MGPHFLYHLEYLKAGPLAQFIHSSAPVVVLAIIIFVKGTVKKISPLPVKILVNNKSVKIVAAVPVKSISEYRKVKILAPV